MAKSSIEEDAALAIGLISLAALILIAILASVFVLPVAVVLVVAWILWRNHRKSDGYREKIARKHTEELYRAALALAPKWPNKEEFGREVYARLPSVPESVEDVMLEVALDLYDEEHFEADVPPVPAICNSLDGQHYRDFLAAYSAKAHNPQAPRLAIETLAEAFTAFAEHIPDLRDKAQLVFEVPLADVIDEQPLCVEKVAVAFFAEEIKDGPVFRALRKRLDANYQEVSRSLSRAAEPVPPADYEGDDVAYRYLRGTPLLKLFAATVPFAIRDAARFEHHHIVAGTGHGKTQAMQYMIACDLEAVERGEASVIVMDSQRQMIPIISRLACFAPGGALHGRLIVIDPTDVAFPIALSVFRMKDHADPAEAERLRNSAVSLLSYALGGLLAAQMTSFQQTLFGFVIRLCMVVPNATIITFVEVLEDASRFEEHFPELSPLARKFFETQYDEPEFRRTRGEVARRAWGILENDTFTRMFSAPRSRLDFYEEMNAGKVILIDTAKGYLHEASRLFGRFFIAMVLQATQERTSGRSLPTFFYIDEAHEYFDANVATMLEQARKSRVGLILAHQYLGQLGDIRESVMANTAVKFAGGVSHEDAASLARAMHTTVDTIRGQRPLSFAVHVKGQGAVSVSVPRGHMEDLPRMSEEGWHIVRDEMRERYAFVALEQGRDAETLPEAEPDADRASVPVAASEEEDVTKPGAW